MAHEFVLPDIGEGLTEAEVVSWLVAVGDEVAEGDPLCEVETAKAVVEIPSPYAGFVLHLGAAEEETVPVGAVLVVIGDRGEAWEQAGTASDPAPTQPQAPNDAAGSASTPQAMPVVRRLAREHGIDLDDVRGTGPQGRITRQDVLSLVGGPSSSMREAETRRLSPTRRAIADHLSRSWREIPHVTTYDDVDARPLLEARETAPWASLEALLITAVLPGLEAFPEFNATLDGDDLTMHGRYDIAVAIDTADGLIVPVVTGAAGMSLEQLARRVGELAEAARARTLTPDQLRGATFTISNIGALGGGHGTPIIPLGTTAILSFGKIVDKPVASDGAVVVTPILPLSLSYDHRVIDGALGRRFIDAVADSLSTLPSQ